MSQSSDLSHVVVPVTGAVSQNVKLSLPGFSFTSMKRTFSRAVMIDRLDILYEPTAPMNAQGVVAITVSDNRLADEGDMVQCVFTVPLNCKCRLTYYGSSWVSSKEMSSPWEVSYLLKDTTLRDGVSYCRLTGKLKYGSSKILDTITVRPPSVEILTRGYTVEHVNVYHVGAAQPPRLLGRTLSSKTQNNRASSILTGRIGGDAYWDSDMRPRGACPSIEQCKEIDIGPSASDCGSDECLNTGRASVSIPVSDLVDTLVSAIDRINRRPNPTTNVNIS